MRGWLGLIDRLQQEAGKKDGEMAGERVAFLVENGYDYVGAQHPVPEVYNMRLER